MSATERVRELLDERGVEWWPSDDRQSESIITHWRVGFIQWTAIEGEKDLWLNAGVAGYDPLTPEQAIAATLGSCNCSNSERTDGTCKVDVLNTGDCAGYECSEYIMHCNGCGHEFGHVLYNEDGDVWMSEKPRYCPNCGRRIEVDE